MRIAVRHAPRDPIHSKDPQIYDLDAVDFLRNRPYGDLGDTTSNYSTNGAFLGADAVMFNAFDWDDLQQQMLNGTSTGPGLSIHFMTPTSPALAGVGNTRYVFSRRQDGRIYYNRAP